MKKPLTGIVLLLALTGCSTATPEPTPTVTVTAEPVEVVPQACFDAITGLADLMVLALEMQEKVPDLSRSIYERDLAASEALSSGYVAKSEEMDALWPDVQPLIADCKSYE